MSNVNNVLNNVMAQSVGAGATNSTSSNSSSSGTANGFMTSSNFFKLLTAQLSHQDPLAPMNGTQFLGEMAQLSSATGIQTLQQSLQSLESSVASSNSLRAGSLVGHRVGFSGNQLYLNGSSTAEGAYTLPSSANKVQVQIHNSKGQVVQTLNLGSAAAGTHTFQWSGSGQPAGQYSFVVNASDASGQPISAQTQSLAKVSSVQFGSNGVTLRFANRSGTLPFAQVNSVF